MTIVITSIDIAQFRSELVNNPSAMAALDMIEECEGDLEDAAISLAIRSGQEPDTSDRWLEGLAKRWRHVICQAELRGQLQPGNLIQGVEALAAATDLPARLATLVAIYVLKHGIDDFCQAYDVRLQVS